MIEFLKYMRGYLRIRVWGFSPERFMNLCSNKGILLWDIVPEGETYTMCINLKSFRALRPIVRKTGTRVVILERYGLPFFLSRLQSRKLFVVGLFLAVAFWIVSALFVWDIELEGNYRITEDVFQTFLSEQQVKIGMYKESLDIERLEKEIRRRFPQITWASAKLSGTKLVISVKENDAPILKEEVQGREGRDLVSEYDGTIVSVIVRSGVPMVKAGDVVEKGAVLVDGKVPVYNDDTTVREYLPVDADADIILEHITNFSARLDFDYIKKEYTGREKKSYYLRVGEKELKWPGEDTYLVQDSLIRESRPLVFEKLSVPVYFGSKTEREYQNVEYEYTLEEAEQALNEKIIAFIASLQEKGVQIIEKDVKIDTNSGSWVIYGEFLVREPVGTSVETVIPNTGEASINE